MRLETGACLGLSRRAFFPQFDYDTKPKHESKAREIGRAEVTEMKEDGVEDHRTIELDLF